MRIKIIISNNFSSLVLLSLLEWSCAMIMATSMDMNNIIQDINMVITIFIREMPMPTILDMDTMVFMGKNIFTDVLV